MTFQGYCTIGMANIVCTGRSGSPTSQIHLEFNWLTEIFIKNRLCAVGKLSLIIRCVGKIPIFSMCTSLPYLRSICLDCGLFLGLGHTKSISDKHFPLFSENSKIDYVRLLSAIEWPLFHLSNLLLRCPSLAQSSSSLLYTPPLLDKSSTFDWIDNLPPIHKYAPLTFPLKLEHPSACLFSCSEYKRICWDLDYFWQLGTPNYQFYHKRGYSWLLFVYHELPNNFFNSYTVIF